MLTPNRKPSDPPGNEAALRVESDRRWGLAAPVLLRAVAGLLWVSLVTRLLAAALPGSVSDIEGWIRRTDTASSLTAQLAVLLGSTELVLLAVVTLGARPLGYVYRIAILFLTAPVLLLVMLASTIGLEPEQNVALATSCLAMAAFAAVVAIRRVQSRAQGLVLVTAVLGSTLVFAARLVASHPASHDPVSTTRIGWYMSLGFGLDAIAVALAATRFVAERRNVALAAVLTAMLLAGCVTWGAVHGSLDGATVWQVISSRSLAELNASPLSTVTPGSRGALGAFSVLLAGVVVLWPGRISWGALSAGLAILARPSVDVPATALVLALAALSAPIGSATTKAPEPAVPRPPTNADA